MELFDALRHRRSVRRFADKPVADEVVEEIMTYAPWVPNHHLSEPWRFVIIKGKSLEQLAALRGESILKSRAEEPNVEIRAERAREEFLRSALVVAVIQHLDPDAHRREEDYASIAMAAYNITLAAWDRGIGSYWNTGPLVLDEGIHQWLDLTDEERLVAFIRMGYPELVPQSRRTPINERTEWRC